MTYEVVEAESHDEALTKTRYRLGAACITRVHCSSNCDGTWACWADAEPVTTDQLVQALRTAGYTVEKRE